jgi:hypothetical protein
VTVLSFFPQARRKPGPHHRAPSRGEILAAAESWTAFVAEEAEQADAHTLRQRAHDYEESAMSGLALATGMGAEDQLRALILVGRYAWASRMFRAALEERGG